MKRFLSLKIIAFAVFVLVLLFICRDLFADILVLTDGTVIVGKVVEEKEDSISLSNSYKVFEIKKSQIRNKYITNHYKEDVDIYKGLGLQPDEIIIKKDYLAGLEKITKKEGWNGKVSLFASYYGTMGNLHDKIPYCYGFFASYDQNLNSFAFLQPLAKSKYLPLIPYLRTEIEYNRYQKESAKLDKVGFFVGPAWTYPMVKKEWGDLHFSILPGFSYLDASYKKRRKSGCTYSQNMFLGYEFVEGRISLLAQIRYIYVADKTYHLHGLGIAFGAGYKIW